MEYTYDELKEMMKCYEDPLYFIENYIMVKHPSEGLIKFEMNDERKSAVESYKKETKFVKIMPRQSGKTVLLCALALYESLFRDYKTSIVLAFGSVHAQELHSMIYEMYQNLPRFLKIGIPERNKTQIRFESMSSIIFTTTGSFYNVARGRTINGLFIDEIEFIDGIHKVFNDFLPCMASQNQKITALSSARYGETLKYV